MGIFSDVIGGFFGGSNAQQDALGQARGEFQQGQQETKNELFRASFGQQSQLAPFTLAGFGALDEFLDLLGVARPEAGSASLVNSRAVINPLTGRPSTEETAAAPVAANLTTAGGTSAQSQSALGRLAQTPGFQFRTDQANQALERRGAALGQSLSGNQLSALSELNQGLASQEFQNRLNQLLPIIQGGQQASQQIGQGVLQTGANVAGIEQQTGQTLSNFALQQGTLDAQQQSSGLSGILSGGISGALTGGLTGFLTGGPAGALAGAGGGFLQGGLGLSIPGFGGSQGQRQRSNSFGSSLFS